MQSESSKKLALFIIVIAFVTFVYGTYSALKIVDRTQISTSEGVYTSYVSDAEQIQKKAYEVSENCANNVCKIQALLDFASYIPYQTNTFQKNSPQKTIQKNFGDCDDKSNLLISMLHALQIEAYFVLVPHHVFVIVSLEDQKLEPKKGLWINGKKYYILESTAEGSSIGFPLHYSLEKIHAIVEPFANEKIDIRTLEYKL